MENVMSLLRATEITSLAGKHHDVLIFKTDVGSERDVEKIGFLFSEDARIKKWSIDLKDVDKVLRIEAVQLQEHEVIEYLTHAGYGCAELND